jgi:hypothetical protein
MSVLAALLLAGVLGPCDHGDEVAALFTRTLGDRRGRAELVAELTDLGGRERGRLVRLALGEGIEELLVAANGTPWIVAPEAWPGLAGEALLRLPGRATCEALAVELGDAPAPARRRAALRLLPGLESSSCSQLAWLLFRGQDPLTLAAPAQKSEALAALTSGFRHDGTSAAQALVALEELAPLQQEIVLLALGAAGRSELADGVEEWLGDPHAPLYRPALATLAELERRAPQDLAGRGLAAFVDGAPWMEAVEQAEHLLTLASCEDPELLPLVAELVDSNEVRTRRLARAAWESLTRSQPDEEAEPRAAWHARELAWYATRLEPALAEFGGEDPAVAVRALHECLRHPLFRRELAAQLALALVHARTEAALAAIPALAAWGSHAAVPGLEFALDAESREVRTLAAETLRLLTGVAVVPGD